MGPGHLSLYGVLWLPGAGYMVSGSKAVEGRQAVHENEYGRDQHFHGWRWLGLANIRIEV